MLEAPVTVYNFQVEDYHTYYVSDFGVLVHNTCRNSGGRHGGTAHRNKVQEIKDSLTSKGWNVSARESRVMLPDGRYRYPDITATKNGITRFYQVGWTTSHGSPVAREVRALRDLGQIAETFFLDYD